LSHERSIRQFVQDIKDATGVSIRVRHDFYRGVYQGKSLVDSETGSEYVLGRVFRHVLSPEEQESICRELHRKEWMVLLGLNPPEDDD
jgi:hypothetical protein